MKYLLSVLTIVLVFISCGNDDGESVVKRKVKNDTNDFYVYVGSDTGAVRMNYDTITNQDSLSFVKRNELIPVEYSSVKDSGNITFEFKDDKLVYTDANRQIIADYMYRNDSLYVLKNSGKETSKVFVVRRDTKDGSYFRTKSIQKLLLDSTIPGNENKTEIRDEILNIEDAFKLAGFSSLKDLKNPKDTVLWFNIRYLYK